MDFKVELPAFVNANTGVLSNANDENAHYFYLWRDVGCIPSRSKSNQEYLPC
jgi:hypothetical protein